jgi:hypothetical protein
MSHVTRLRGVKFTDVRAIEQAVKTLQDKGIKCSIARNTSRASTAWIARRCATTF